MFSAFKCLMITDDNVSNAASTHTHRTMANRIALHIHGEYIECVCLLFWEKVSKHGIDEKKRRS